MPLPTLHSATAAVAAVQRHSHYFHARLPRQFDAIVHLDATRALVPLDRRAGAVEADAPETYPSGV